MKISLEATKSVDSGFSVPIGQEDAEAENLRILSLTHRDAAKGSRWIVPAEEPLELLFFRRIFTELQKQCSGEPGVEGDEDVDVPIAMFQRAFERLFYVLADEQGEPFDARTVDKNCNGFVGWAEFAVVFKHRALKIKLSTPERIFITFDNPDSSMVSFIISAVVLVTITVSSLCFILSTAPEFMKDPVGVKKPEPLEIFDVMENICLFIFVFEYVIRLGTCWAVRDELFDRKRLLQLTITSDTIRPSYPAGRLISFIFQLSNVVDLVAIAPGVVGWIVLIADPDGNGLEGGGFVVLRLVRLTRILRAFKNPKLVEPVIVIARTIHQSTKALYVLGFNLLLGILIFGSLMYLAEGGVWDAETRTYNRFIGTEYNTTSGKWDEVMEPSPFTSIPHAFWWAVVTAMTVGYGDMFPTRTMGYVVAVVTMLFSLVVLALPVGVIGGNFSNAWSNYEAEKQQALADKEKDKRYITAAIQRIEPFEMSKLMLLEVWNERCPFDRGVDGEHVWGPPRDEISKPDVAEFMGMVSLRLELPPDTAVNQTHKLKLKPQSNDPYAKVAAITGTITVQYEWTPAPAMIIAPLLVGPPTLSDGDGADKVDLVGGDTPDEEITALRGQLKLTMVSADGLVNLSYLRAKKSFSNAFAMVYLYPTSPSPEEHLCPSAWRSPCDLNTLSPQWGASNTWDVHWLEPPSETPRPSPPSESTMSVNAPIYPDPCISSFDVKGAAFADGEILKALQGVMREVSQLREEVRVVGGRIFQKIDKV